MSKVANEAMTINPSVNHSTTTESALTKLVDIVELIKCDCCGLTEECTAAYIKMICQRYQGKWICGLCAEAVSYEMRLFNIEDALIQHMRFCNQFKSPPNPTVHLISAMTHILRRGMSSKQQGRFSQSKIRVSSLSVIDQNHEMNISEHPTTEL